MKIDKKISFQKQLKGKRYLNETAFLVRCVISSYLYQIMAKLLLFPLTVLTTMRITDFSQLTEKLKYFWERVFFFCCFFFFTVFCSLL